MRVCSGQPLSYRRMLQLVGGYHQYGRGSAGLQDCQPKKGTERLFLARSFYAILKNTVALDARSTYLETVVVVQVHMLEDALDVAGRDIIGELPFLELFDHFVGD